ncbi:hypothetical protein SAMN05444064_102412 [Pseudomonas syringae]|nr:hypothetical protein SAMN05444514_1346 [Pseudomonas syringae]SFL58652.1 hypothetical protein SAMN05444064_102412 [Pseudomonas syringae]
MLLLSKLIDASISVALAKERCICLRYNSAEHTDEIPMKLLNTYEDRDDAEDAAEKLMGEKRLASERDATVVIYNLFGIANWGNLHRLGMYNLPELKLLLESRADWQSAHQARHAEIITTLKTVAKNYSIELPSHWL